MSDMKHTPGPWTPVKCSRPQVAGDWFVVRNISIRPSFSHYEQLRNVDGDLLRFESEQQALEAIAKATGSEA